MLPFIKPYRLGTPKALMRLLTGGKERASTQLTSCGGGRGREVVSGRSQVCDSGVAAIAPRLLPSPLRGFSCNLGLRAKEIAGLTWDRIDWQTKTLLLKTTKGNKPRHVPMAADLVKTLKAYREVSRSKKTHVFLNTQSKPGQASRPTLSLRGSVISISESSGGLATAHTRDAAHLSPRLLARSVRQADRCGMCSR